MTGLKLYISGIQMEMSVMLIGTFNRLVSTDIAASKKSATSKSNSALFSAFVTLIFKMPL